MDDVEKETTETLVYVDLPKSGLSAAEFLVELREVIETRNLQNFQVHPQPNGVVLSGKP